MKLAYLFTILLVVGCIGSAPSQNVHTPSLSIQLLVHPEKQEGVGGNEVLLVRLQDDSIQWSYVKGDKGATGIVKPSENNYRAAWRRISELQDSKEPISDSVMWCFRSLPREKKMNRVRVSKKELAEFLFKPVDGVLAEVRPELQTSGCFVKASFLYDLMYEAGAIIAQDVETNERSRTPDTPSVN